MSEPSKGGNDHSLIYIYWAACESCAYKTAIHGRAACPDCGGRLAPYSIAGAVVDDREDDDLRTDGSGEREPSAITITFDDETDDLDELTPALVARFADRNPEFELESVTFRAMIEDSSAADLVPEIPDDVDDQERDP